MGGRVQGIPGAGGDSSHRISEAPAHIVGNRLLKGPGLRPGVWSGQNCSISAEDLSSLDHTGSCGGARRGWILNLGFGGQWEREKSPGLGPQQLEG